MSFQEIVSQTLTEDVARVAVLVAVVAVTLFLFATGRPVPSELIGIDGVVIGYYFGRGVTNGKA